MMNASKEIVEIRIIDLLEQVQEVDKLIKNYSKDKQNPIAITMLKQYSVRRQDLVNVLDNIFKKYSLTVV